MAKWGKLAINLLWNLHLENSSQKPTDFQKAKSACLIRQVIA